MNKKVLTLCASFLLAGGLTSQAWADTFKRAAATYSDGQYFYVNVDFNATAASGVTNDDQQLDVNGTITNPSALTSFEENRSTWWRLEAVKVKDVNGTETLIGYKLINALTNKPFTVTVGTTVYDTFQENVQQLKFVNAKGQAIASFNGTLTSVGAGNAGVYYSLQAVPVEELAYDEVNKVNNGYFGLQFGYIKDNKYVNYEGLQGVDPFVGKLVASNTSVLKLRQLPMILTSSTTKQ